MSARYPRQGGIIASGLIVAIVATLTTPTETKAADRAPDSTAIVRSALEGPVALTACVEASDAHCRVESLCPIRGGWEKVNAAIRQSLEAVSLADLVFSSFDDPAALPAKTGAEEREQL